MSPRSRITDHPHPMHIPWALPMALAVLVVVAIVGWHA